MHCHGYHQVSKEDGFGTVKGPIELKLCIDMLNEMVEGSIENTSMRKIYANPPHITVNNYFVSDAIMDYAGGLGFGLLGTCRRDRLPKGVLRDYFHYDKHIPKCKRARIAKFFNPIIAIKEVEAKMEERPINGCMYRCSPLLPPTFLLSTH